MADIAQLRKCEELLEKLPAEKLPTARPHRPLWVFLKGLEGFDTERASECLEKLLDKHYDTVAVLKLATKRDLVEDAGILPGDALRIVAAAKDYVAAAAPVVEVNPSPTGHGHASKPVQQDAYQPRSLRETTVVFAPPVVAVQSSLHAHEHAHFPAVKPQQQQQQQKGVQVVNQGAASSQQEAAVKEDKAVLNQVAPTLEPPGKLPFPGARCAPADPALPTPWRAFVDGSTGFMYYWNPVMNITQSTKPLPFGVPSGSPVAPAPPPRSGPKVPEIGPPTVPNGITYPHTCWTCNAKCISESHARTHYNGRRHISAVREAKQPAQQVPKAVNASQAQDVWVAKQQQPSPTEHQVLVVKRPSESTPLHACGVCNVKCGSEVDLRSHFNGKKHIQGMQQATESNDNNPTPHLNCSLCDVTCTCKRNLVMHFNGKKHALIMKELSDSGDSSYYSDSESDS